MRTQASGARRHARRPRWGRTLEALERRVLLAVDSGTPWHNADYPRDVNGDHRVSPIDALIVINSLLVNGSQQVPSGGVTPLAATSSSTGSSTSGSATKAFLDVNGDNMVSPIDAMQVINLLLVEKVIEISVTPTDLFGTPITTPILVGTDFLLQATVTDVRMEPDLPGVFSAYLNVSYDALHVTIPQPPTFSFDPAFPAGRTFDAGTPGVISGAGAVAGSFTPPATGQAPQKLWTVLMHAADATPQPVSFTPSFDFTPAHDVSVFGISTAIPDEQISWVGSSITIIETPVVSVAAAEVAEGNDGTTPLVFTVSLSSVISEAVTVQFATSNAAGGNAASSASDYQANSGTLTFLPGASLSQVVTVLVNGDLVLEPDEIFNFTLSNPTGAELGTSAVLGTILNDDTSSALAIGDETVTNVTSGTTTAVFTVSLSPEASSPVTVEFATQDGSALAGIDYTATSGTLTFDGTTSQTITVTILGDPNPDEPESFFVNLSNPSVNAFLDDDQAIGTIQPAVPIPDLSVSTAALTEGNTADGNKDFVFTATLSSPAPQPIIVAYATSNGTATTANNDYVPQTGTISFSIGQSQATITIAVVGDDVEEDSETFLVNLSPGSGPLGTIQTPAIGTILNDDGPANFSISDATVSGGAGSQVTDAVFTVSLSVPPTSTVTVSYATEDGSAVANEDYQPQSGIVSFAPQGPLTQLITVPVIGSALPGPDETFFVNLSSPSGGVEINDGRGIGTIVRQGITIGNVSVVEGNSGTSTALFTVNLSSPQGTQVTVAFATADGTATVANADYVPISGTLTFAPSQQSQVVTVTIVGDTVQEGNETFSVNLSNSTGAVIFSNQATGTIINDDGQTARIELRLAHTNGVAFLPGETLDVDDEFLLQVWVQDIQADPNGIAAAYLDVLYNSSLVAINGQIVYGSAFPSIQSGDTSTAGLIDELGAFGLLTPPVPPNTLQLLASVPLRAIDVGLAHFETDPADDPEHEVLQYTSETPIPPDAINFVETSINIGENVFTVDNVGVAEGNSGTTNLEFTITRFLPSAQTATVVYSTADGTATAESDYVAQSGTLTFLLGETSKTVTIVVNGDTTDEEDETFFLQLSDPVGAVASESPGVGTIENDDGPPSASIAPATGSEGDNVNFTVTLSAVSGRIVTVGFATADATSGIMATAGVDYTAMTGTITFAPGVTQQTISIPALPDLVVDANETFRVLLSNPVNTTISTGTALGTIIDVPPAMITGFVYADLNDNGIKEGSEAGIANVTVHAVRNGAIVQSVLTGADGSYALVGLQPGTFSVVEVHPAFFIDGRDTHLGVDSPTNDQHTGIALAPSQVAAGYNFGELGLRAEFVTIFLNRRAFFASSIVTGIFGPINTTTGIDLRTGDAWIAFDGGWNGARTIQALFNAANGSATMTLYNNALEQVAASSPNAGGAQLTYHGTGGPYFLKVSGTNPNVSLVAVDTVSVGNASVLEGANGTSNMVFTVSLTAPQSQTVTVNYATGDGTATAASGDYVATTGALTFAPGEVSKLVTVAINGDAFSELDETFSLVLSSPSNIALGTAAGLGTILNDDGLIFGLNSLFASSSGGSAAPSTASPTATSAEAATAQQPTSPPASEPLAATPTSAADDDAPSAADAALEEDEDWVTDLVLA
jgi:hypothetical protein